MRAPTFLYVPLAQACLATDQTIDALRIVSEALELAQRTGQRLHEAELLRLKGELLLRPSRDESNAEACFLRAISIARAQSAKWWELRSSVSLARLLLKQGHRQEARAMLTEIYNWFTEGFDTRDLQEAQQLLNELAQEL
jgi:predicted ATPase